VATSKNTWLVSTAMIVGGMILGNIGFNPSTGKFFGTFNNDWLSYGIPLFPFIVALYVLPNIMDLDSSGVNGRTIDNAYVKSVGNVRQYFGKMINGSLIGMVAGFVPIIGKIVGVSASRALHRKSDKDSVIAAESSNNSSIFTAMIPLFLFGVPITLGEILIYNVAETNYDLQNEFRSILSSWLLPMLILASGVLGLLLSWPLARYCTYIFRLPTLFLKSMFLAVVLASLLYIGFIKHMTWYYIFVLMAFLPLGYLLRNRDVIPLIFSFIIAKISMTIFERIII